MDFMFVFYSSVDDNSLGSLPISWVA